MKKACSLFFALVASAALAVATSPSFSLSSSLASAQVAASDAPAVDAADAVTYVCPMHPEVTSNAPARCSKCGMHLVPKK
jgi:Heavy metal binding domain